MKEELKELAANGQKEAKGVRKTIEKEVKNVQARVEKEFENRSEIFDGLRKILLAGVGGVALAQDEIVKFIGKMVDRGEIAEKDARKLLDEVMSRRKEQAKKAEHEIDKRVDDIMARMNVPSKADIDALSEKITRLTEKVEQLKKTS